MEECACEEACQVQPIQDKPTESIEGELNIVAKVIPSTTPIEEGNGKGAPQSKAKPPISLQEAKNAKPQVKYIDEYFVRKGENPFLLAEAIPESPQEESSNTSESRRGFRHPKEPPKTQEAKWDGNANWSSRKQWKE